MAAILFAALIVSVIFQYINAPDSRATPAASLGGRTAVASNVIALRNHALTAALTSFTASSNGIASMPCRMGNGCFPLCTKIRRSDPMSFAALWNPRSVVGALDSLISIAQHLPGANSRTRSISAPALSCPPDVGQSALHCQTVSNGFVRCYELLVAASLYSGNYASIFQG